MAALNPRTLGSWRLHSRIGSGGAGIVYAASRGDEAPTHALKVLRAELCRDPDMVRRFQREGRLLTEIRHPCIVPVEASGQDDGRYWLAMPLVTAPTLEVLVARDGPSRSGGRTRPLLAMLDVARALDAVHQRGVVHRDLTPFNVFVPDAGPALVSDFGIVKVLGGESVLTRSGALVGTLPYMAPEQLDGGAVGPAADIYQLGLLIRVALNGKLPFGSSFGDVVRAKCVAPALPDPREGGAQVPDALAHVVMRANEKDPARRFPSAIELAAAMDRALG